MIPTGGSFGFGTKGDELAFRVAKGVIGPWRGEDLDWERMKPIASEENSAVRAGAADGLVTVLAVHGMNCQGCVRKVTETLQSVPGVEQVRVELDPGRAKVWWRAGQRVEPAVLRAALLRVGYGAELWEEKVGERSERRVRRWHWNLWVGVTATVPLMVGEWVLSWGMERWFHWLGFVLAGVVQVYCGAPFYRGAWRQLRAGMANMDTLVALGSTTAFGYSAWVLWTGRGHHVYFMEAAAIITLISLGHWLEARMSARAAETLRALLELQPPEARRLRGALWERAGSAATAQEEVVPVSALRAGDYVVLRPGDRVPVDGEVLEGESALDESMLTGESVPVEKGPGARLFAGTMVLDGRLVMRVTATGAATVLAQIIAAVQRAQQSRADIQRLGDRVSAVFVPVVIGVAVASGCWWGLWPESARRVHDALAPWLWPAAPPEGTAAAFVIAAAVLIVACPCAMGLATPAAIMAAANVAARRGFLIRDGVALEKAGRLTTVLFDKTGTLTQGRPEVVAVESLEDSEADLWLWATTVAELSAHPLSHAVAAYCRARLADLGGTSTVDKAGRASGLSVVVQQGREVRGAGVEARLAVRTDAVSSTEFEVRLGSLRWLEQQGVPLARAEAFLRDWGGRAATVLGLARDGRLLALFAVRDTLKPAAAEVVAALRRMGLQVGMVTGDSAVVARALAQELGLDQTRVLAEVPPEAKAQAVRALQDRGERVAFVGDGINDAPALEQADLGIAVARATDIARESADIVLLRSDLRAVPEALGLARASLRTIYQNLFWAFFYNALGVPLAALGFLSPVLCALAMGLSDLLVIGNALRLRRWQPSGRLIIGGHRAALGTCAR